MRSAKVVIGANFGDEGKGLMTDRFASQSRNGVVVRFNGGSQAAHTVETLDGKRHVFGHFGAGTCAGFSTYLSRSFIVNPLTFFKERQAFVQNFGRLPEVSYHPACPLTTPWDMLINQQLERSRGDSRHGSCGLGINETVYRHSKNAFRLVVDDVNDYLRFKQKLYRIVDEWVPARCAELGIEVPELTNNHSLFVDFVDKSLAFSEQHQRCFHEYLRWEENIIFEGAQGLLLDEDHYYFPHVTRSKTGLRNVLEIAKDAEIADLDVCYVTRCYLTRHGAGPLPNMLFQKPYERIADKTNIPNEWQGSLRFAPLDVGLLRESIMGDLGQDWRGINVRHSLAVTCLDQADKYIMVTAPGSKRVQSLSEEELISLLFKEVAPQQVYKSYGPTRSTVKVENRPYAV